MVSGPIQIHPGIFPNTKTANQYLIFPSPEAHSGSYQAKPISMPPYSFSLFPLSMKYQDTIAVKAEECQQGRWEGKKSSWVGVSNPDAPLLYCFSSPALLGLDSHCSLTHYIAISSSTHSDGTALYTLLKVTSCPLFARLIPPHWFITTNIHEITAYWSHADGCEIGIRSANTEYLPLV